MMCGKYTSSDRCSRLRARARAEGLARPQRRRWRDVFQVFEDLRGIEDLDRAVHQHRHLLLRVDAQDFGMLRAVTRLRVVRHHHEIEVEPLLSRGDLDLGAEHAERPGVESEARHFLLRALLKDFWAASVSARSWSISACRYGLPSAWKTS